MLSVGNTSVVKPPIARSSANRPMLELKNVDKTHLSL
ncbi:conserved hypothetical protein [Burkholderia cenocepacia J2315]|uniref:Uncharacterized protein n=1 Tax=Burkholderia cenocepacia (strain ATCC BAA-245 / DSM 16553 / LMG 16656 / NCTC 13227 / J2315 / CF5610) TaxID=216591 RepID=B4EAY6_BURCJ|nr:conserved hypothetical protein [Burkholderia cenocepacia J2315]